MAQDPFKYFRVEAHELLEQFDTGVLELEKGQGTAETTQKILRAAHTLKGASRVVKQSAIAEQAHAIEELLQPFRQSTLAVPRATLDQLLGCLDTIRAALRAIASPAAAEAPNPGAPAPVEEAFRTVRAEIAEMDELLEGISETHAQLRALHKATLGVERARQLADLLLDQLTRQSGREIGRQGGVDKLTSIVAELRSNVGALEQKLGTGIEQVQRELGQVRAAAEQLRLLPAGGIFTSLERSAQDSARALGKQVSFEAVGSQVRLDAHVLEVARGALLQLVRNAVAHGIESAAERKAAGKPAAGRVTIHISRRGRRVLLRCQDDGRGIDLDGVRRMLQRRGMAGAELSRLGRDELLRQLLRGGISTSVSVNQVAGRGIGLDVVREAAERLGGQVEVETTAGLGSVFLLVVPLSIASLEGLVVEVNGALVTVPLDSVRRTLRVSSNEVTRTEQGQSIVCDGHAIPFVALARVLRPSVGPLPEAPRVWSAVVLERDGQAAIGVDRLLGTATIVLRPLPQYAAADSIIAGVSIDADGNPRLVLDPDELVTVIQRGRFADAQQRPERRSILVIDDSLTTRMLEQSILESAGYEVDTASSAEEALVRARQKRYALFLVDVEMPGMDGFTFVQRTRADPELSRVPAILVTSLSAPEHLARGKEVGAQGYVIKSEFDQADLLRRIRGLVE
jgi:two-component system, chemotaxis family, sensor kinase CheA